MTYLRATLIAFLSFWAVLASAVDLWGTIVWSTRSPAVGIELRLLSGNGQEVARIYTNNVGRYGLFGLSEPTSSYTLQVVRDNAIVQTTTLPQLGDGGHIPDIVIQ